MRRRFFGKSTIYIGVYSKSFTKNDCSDGGYGTSGAVTQDDVTGGPFISYISQEDADNKAKAAVEAQGQSIVNSRYHCFWYGHYSNTFCKQCTEGGIGSCFSVNESYVGYPTSYVSQSDADSIARERVMEQGQNIANQRGSCTWTGTYIETFTKNNCSDGGTGSDVVVDQDMVTGAPFTSINSKSEADDMARTAVKSQGQAIANSLGHCTWTGTYSKSFTKNNCTDGGSGSSVTVDQDDVTGRPFTSTVSQADADSKAKSAVDEQGQSIANSNGYCTWTGTYSKSFTRNNCGTCQHGSSVTVDQNDVTGHPFTSTTSKADADNKAKTAVNEYGQAYANSHGSCIADDSSASWSDTGSTRCNGCTSQKQQRDTNSCSSTYNDTRWVDGGGRSCSDWEYYGSGDCVGHTAYSAYRDSCSGTVDNRYSVSCNNCCNCGSYSATTEYRCSGTTRQRKYVDDCGNVDWRTYQTNSPDCGGCTCSLTVNNVSFDYSGGTKKSTVSSSCGSSSISYTASSNQSWCSVSVVSGGVNVTCSANSSYSSRSATVTVTQNGSPCSSSKSFTVSQSGKPNDYVFSFADGVTGNRDYSAVAAGKDIQYTITSTKNGSAQGWSVTDDLSWLTASKDGSVLKISISANATTSTRTGKVTLTQSESGKTLSVTITQPGVNPQPTQGTLQFCYQSNSASDPSPATFDVTFTRTGGETANLNRIIARGECSNITLNPGTWTVSVNSIRQTYSPYATGRCAGTCTYMNSTPVTQFTIQAGKTTNMSCKPSW